jgi:hypothetical protein
MSAVTAMVLQATRGGSTHAVHATSFQVCSDHEGRDQASRAWLTSPIPRGNVCYA